MLTWLGAWIVLEFVAIVLYGLFRRPRKTEEIQVQLVSRPDVVHDVSTPVKRTSENKVYETDLSEIERPCEECGEYNCLSLIRHGNDESFIRCNNCFALQSLNKIAGRDSTFFPMALNDMFAYDSQSAIALLHEVMKYQTLEEICISRHCFLKGEAPDLMRASRLLMEDFRSGKIGRITLEYPEEWQ